MRSLSAYNETAEFGYLMAESRLRKCIRLMESLAPGEMLDVGCSDGKWLQYWSSRGWRPHGVDLERKSVETACGRGINAKFCDLNSGTIPFPDVFFDLVFAGEVIEHLIDTDGFLSEISRVTKTGGHLLITTPNLASIENRVRLMLGMYPKWLNYNLEGSGHVRGYTPRAIKNQLLRHGLKTLIHLGNWVPFIPQHFTDDVKIPALAITGDWFPNLSMDIIILAQKLDDKINQISASPGTSS